MIKIISIGKIKEKYLNEFIDDYLKRCNKYHDTRIIELKDENDLKKEAKSIIKYIDSKDYVISLDINGREYTSIELSHLIEKTFITNPNITFIIGGSIGLDDEVKNLSNELISFGRITIPHGVFRAILLEQIYRAFKIMNNESYHK